jgi:hypothetical protein
MTIRELPAVREDDPPPVADDGPGFAERLALACRARGIMLGVAVAFLFFAASPPVALAFGAAGLIVEWATLKWLLQRPLRLVELGRPRSAIELVRQLRDAPLLVQMREQDGFLGILESFCLCAAGELGLAKERLRLVDAGRSTTQLKTFHRMQTMALLAQMGETESAIAVLDELMPDPLVAEAVTDLKLMKLGLLFQSARDAEGQALMEELRAMRLGVEQLFVLRHNAAIVQSATDPAGALAVSTELLKMPSATGGVRWHVLVDHVHFHLLSGGDPSVALEQLERFRGYEAQQGLITRAEWTYCSALAYHRAGMPGDAQRALEDARSLPAYPLLAKRLEELEAALTPLLTP